MAIAVVVVALIGYLGLRRYLEFQGRVMIHRERLAAIEKGMDLPPFDADTRPPRWSVRTILLLGGLIWLSIAVGTFIALTALSRPEAHNVGLPPMLRWTAVMPACIGLSHLIVYAMQRRKDNRS